MSVIFETKLFLHRVLKRLLRNPLSRIINLYKLTNGDLSHFSHFEYFQKKGIHITPNHFYQPIPDTRGLDWNELSKDLALEGIEMNEKKQLLLLNEKFSSLGGEFSSFRKISSRINVGKNPNFYFGNKAFDGVDASVYYCMIRSLKPKKIIEVGSGWSTKIAAKACLMNKNSELISIEPYPQPALKKGFPGFSKLIEERVEDMPSDFFQTLKGGDVLFIDSSHTVKIGGDVTFLFLEVLPKLNKGVYVHIHDIFLPFDYPKEWVMTEHRFWTEQYLLHAFLLFNNSFEVVYANNFMGYKYPNEVRRVFAPATNKIFGGSFWIKKVK